MNVKTIPAAAPEPPADPAAPLIQPSVGQELRAMGRMWDELASLDAHARRRVLDWLCDKNHSEEL